ncbi:cytochrome P450 2D20-like isoform X3 [Ruditapes philippinarum]|uniref:cytochrome P450 2D20-like isoform X3 n=1 Tax=Ruditapes philippinarum TaxID=129788 RepID=UPI00295A7E65|nr:cytochrome P450 2D20-like isoform X3 [Ruditapes philippinarum]
MLRITFSAAMICSCVPRYWKQNRVISLINSRRMHEEKANGCPFNHEKATAYIKPETVQPVMAAPPGPGGPPIIGQAFNLDTDYMHLQFMDWQKRFGDMFMFKVFGKSFLVISDPDILRSMFITCEHANRFNDRPASFMGKYVINRTQDIVFRNCDDIQQTLKIASMNYVENTLMQEKWFYEKCCEECGDIVKTLEQTEDSALVDIVDILDRFSVKVIGLLISGRRIKEEDPEFKSLCNFMEAGNELGTVKNQTILTTIPGVRKIPGQLKDAYDQINDEKEKIKQFFITENKSEDGLVAMLKKLAASIAEESRETWLNEDFMMGVIMDLTAAAIVPLKHTLSVLFLVLTHHPDIQNRIRQEVQNSSEQVTIDRFTETPYTAASILELKRFHTPLPISARHCNRSGAAKFEKYNIPKNTQIFSNLFGIHHDERFWTDPWTFQPERFLTQEGKLIADDHPTMKNFVVTGVGPRKCIGSKFSENVIFLITANILKNLQVLPCDKEPLPACDPREFLPGVVTRVPNFKCMVRKPDSEV